MITKIRIKKITVHGDYGDEIALAAKKSREYKKKTRMNPHTPKEIEECTSALIKIETDYLDSKSIKYTVKRVVQSIDLDTVNWLSE